MAGYIARFNVAFNGCSNITDIKAEFLFKENPWAKVAVQVINFQPSSLRDSQAIAQRTGSILKYAGMFEHAKKGSKKGKMLFLNVLKKDLQIFNLQMHWLPH